MTGTELLHEAARLVRTGWCQGADAREASGAITDVDASDAASWSLLGALQAASVCDPATRIDDVAAAVGAIAELIADPSLAHWNDASTRTKLEVLALLEDAEAIALANWIDPSGLDG
jgi:hypothetical protein